MDDRQRIAMVETKTGEQSLTRYQLDNHLGSSSIELDENANLISYEEYHPFGTTSYRAGRNAAEVSLKRYRYIGKERDEETGLYYYGFRYYDSSIARFINCDPIANDYLHVNPYNYAENMPISYIDLWGLQRYFTPYGEPLGFVGTNNEIRIIKTSHTKKWAQTQIWKSEQHGDINAAKAKEALINQSVSLVDYAENIPDVLNGATVVRYVRNCYDAAKEQMENSNTFIEFADLAIPMKVDNSRQIPFTRKEDGVTYSRPNLIENKIGGVIYIMTQLKEGKPAMIGIERRRTVDVGNYNALTNHFLVITAMKKESGFFISSITFEMYENINASKGNVAEFNIFSGEIIREHDDAPVTEVMRNKKK